MLITGNVALVSYVSGPLARFLDSLRRELTPTSRPRAHVTVLPPRPLEPHLDPLLARLVEERCGASGPLEIELGDVDIFPLSDVIHLNLRRGTQELCELYQRLNCGLLSHETPYQYHPHLTLAQGLNPANVQTALAFARNAWEAYTGPRVFPIEDLSLVRQSEIDIWRDIAQISLNELMASTSTSERRRSRP